MKKHEQFSHTTRSFDLTRPVDSSLIAKINRIIDANKDIIQNGIIIDDPVLIEQLYQISDIPDEHELGVQSLPRKNGQVSSPLVVIINPKDYDHMSNYTAGKMNSEIGLMAIDAGYNTGFCTCFDRDKTGEIFRNYTAKRYFQMGQYLTTGAVILSIGYIAKNTTPQHDVRQLRVVTGYPKATRDYIKILN
jgi:hypothetical protein